MPPQSAAIPPSDEELACRAQQGCAASFEELVRRFQVPLLQFLRQRTAAGDAEDLVQDTFVRAYQNLHRYRPAWQFPTWLFTIARRLCINRQRRQRPLAADSQIFESLPSGSRRPEQIVAEEESRRHLWNRAAEVLTEPQMTVTWLYYVEEMSVKQIGRVQGRSQVAVKTMLFRARQKLLPVLLDLEAANSERNWPVKHGNPTAKNSSSKKAAEVTHG